MKFNTNKRKPVNPRNNCICDRGDSGKGTPCYYHIKKGAWYSKYGDEQIFPDTWEYALLPSTPTASFENLLLTLVRFGVNLFNQEFVQLSPEKQQEIFDEWNFTKKSLLAQTAEGE